MQVSSRAGAATASPTLALTAQVKAMKAAGESVIGFGAGEPDFDTPEHIKEAAIEAIRDGFTKYCPASGIPSLKAAVVEDLAARRGLSYDPPQVIISNGGKHALFGVFQALLDPGDAVFLPAPYWVSYVDQIRLAGGVPIVLPTAEATGLKLTAGQLAEAFAAYPYAKAMVFNSPSNPTGATYDEPELAALAEVIATRPSLTVLSDEIYEHLIYDGRRHRSLLQFPELRSQVVLLSGVAKTYAMTGWRVGWAVGDATLISAMGRIQSHDTSGTCSIAQVAAEAALRGDQSCVETMRQAFEARRRVMIDGLRALPGVTCSEPYGAFYAFPNVSGCLAAGETASDFAARLLAEAKVAVVPGEGFGAPTGVRLSYAASLEDIQEGLRRLARFLGA